jgi:four helix bundle protein
MQRSPLDFERLDVYRCAIEFLALAVRITAHMPRGHSDLRDQLRRASSSIPLNIAEACGKTGTADRAHFHSIARGSAFECAAILDVSRASVPSRPRTSSKPRRSCRASSRCSARCAADLIRRRPLCSSACTTGRPPPRPRATCPYLERRCSFSSPSSLLQASPIKATNLTSYELGRPRKGPGSCGKGPMFVGSLPGFHDSVPFLLRPVPRRLSRGPFLIEKGPGR